MLKILHLSDIHFGQEKNGEVDRNEDIRRQLVSDLKSILEGSEPLDLILINGDIAYGGKPLQYDDAVEWLDEIIKVGRCDESVILTIPGNHDVDLDLISLSAKLVHTQLRTTTAEAVNPVLHSYTQEPQEVNAIFPKFRAYVDFARGYNSDFEAADVPRWIRYRPIKPGFQLRIIGMCSVQVCDLEDRKGKMILGQKQYIFPEDQSVITLVMVHHPMSWLLDSADAWNYIKNRSSILLTGHEHLPDLNKVVQANGNERIEISAGTITATKSAEPLEFAYNVIELDVKTNPGVSLELTVWPRIWSEGNVAFEPDRGKTGGPISSTFSIKVGIQPDPTDSGPLQTNDPSLVGREMPRNDDAEFGRLKHFFWHHLTWEQRITVLVKAGIWPTKSNTRIPQAIELEALSQARDAGQLALIWDETMSFVPVEKRRQNPFMHEAK